MFKNKAKGFAAAILALSIITSGASLVPSASFRSINANAALNANQKITAFRQYPYIIDSSGLPEYKSGTRKYVVKDGKVYLSEMITSDNSIGIPTTIENKNVAGVTNNFKIIGSVTNVSVLTNNLDVNNFDGSEQSKAEREQKEGYTGAIKGVLQKVPNLKSINYENVIIDGNINTRASQGVRKVLASLNAEDNEAVTKAMVKYINNLAIEITKNTTNDYSKVKALHDWVDNNTNFDDERWRYRDASDWSIFLNPGHLAVCDGYSRGLTLLLRSLNFEAYYEGFQNYEYNSEKREKELHRHAGTIVKIYGDFYHIDSTWDGGGNNTCHEHFLKDDSVYRKHLLHQNVLSCEDDEVAVWSGSNKLVIRFPSTIYTNNGNISNPRINCNTFFCDLNGDKRFDRTDVTRLKDYINKKIRYDNFDSNARKFMDFNHDGHIDITDATEMQNYLDSLNNFNV